MSKESSQVSEWIFFYWIKKVDASFLIIKKYQLITYIKCKQQTSTRRRYYSLICCRSNWPERVLGRDALATVVPAKFELTLLKDVERNMCQQALMNNWRSSRTLINDCYYPSCCSGIFRGQYHFIPLFLAQIFFAGEGRGLPFFIINNYYVIFFSYHSYLVHMEKDRG